MKDNGGLIGGTVNTTYSTTSGVFYADDIARRTALQYAVYPQNNWALAPEDSSFSSVTMLVHCDEFFTTSGHACLRDRSSSANHVRSTNDNSMCQMSTTQTKFGAYAFYNDSLNIGIGGLGVNGTTATLGFGTGDFTIECWAYMATITSGVILDMRPTSTNGNYAAIYLQGTGNLSYYVNSADRITSGNGGITVNTWQHIAAARTSTSTKLFVNGTQVGSTYSDSTNYASAQIRFMVSNAGTGSGNGYLSEVRITKGVCRYTANFTAPTQRFSDY